MIHIPLLSLLVSSFSILMSRFCFSVKSSRAISHVNMDFASNVSETVFRVWREVFRSHKLYLCTERTSNKQHELWWLTIWVPPLFFQRSVLRQHNSDHLTPPTVIVGRLPELSDSKIRSWVPVGLGTKTHCAGEGQQQFSSQSIRPLFPQRYGLGQATAYSAGLNNTCGHVIYYPNRSWWRRSHPAKRWILTPYWHGWSPENTAFHTFSAKASNHK
jgi:hypothetical protein